MCGNITAEQNKKMYDFNVEMCFNFSITTVLCVLVKIVQNVHESRILARKFMAA